MIDQYRQMHEAGKFKGLSLLPYAADIGWVIRMEKIKTILDWGSGKGEQYTVHRCHEAWGVPMPALYDPAVPGIDTKPTGKFDGVICTDVLEHLPEDEVSAALDEIFGYASKVVFLTICTRLARKTLPDGRNCHLTVKPREWWTSRIGSRGILCLTSFS